MDIFLDLLRDIVFIGCPPMILFLIACPMYSVRQHPRKILWALSIILFVFSNMIYFRITFSRCLWNIAFFVLLAAERFLRKGASEELWSVVWMVGLILCMISQLID